MTSWMRCWPAAALFSLPSCNSSSPSETRLTAASSTRMEGKAHSRRDYSPAGRMSRTERDMSSCSLDIEISSERPTSNMIRHLLPKSRTARKPHVCIVGAGMAGIRCAQVMMEKGAKVTVFEGRDRIGGRVRSPWWIQGL